MPRALSWTFLAAVMILVIGTTIRLACYNALGRFFTFELALKPDHTLVTSGPYSVVRHPSYAAVLVGVCGATLVHMGPQSYWVSTDKWNTASGMVLGGAFWAYVAVMCAILFARTRKEDAVMRNKFKGQWQAWAKRTPYLLIPFIY